LEKIIKKKPSTFPIRFFHPLWPSWSSDSVDTLHWLQSQGWIGRTGLKPVKILQRLNDVEIKMPGHKYIYTCNPP
jgi:hypothetical protein